MKGHCFMKLTESPNVFCCFFWISAFSSGQHQCFVSYSLFRQAPFFSDFLRGWFFLGKFPNQLEKSITGRPSVLMLSGWKPKRRAQMCGCNGKSCVLIHQAALLSRVAFTPTPPPRKHPFRYEPYNLNTIWTTCEKTCDFELVIFLLKGSSRWKVDSKMKSFEWTQVQMAVYRGLLLLHSLPRL